MKFYSLKLNKPVFYYMGGEFISTQSWRHQRLNHDGDYEIIVCIRGPIYIQIGEIQYTVHDHQVLIVPPYVNYFGFGDSPDGANFYWLHFFPNEPIKSFETDVQTVTSTIQSMETDNQNLILPIFFTLQEYDDIFVTIHKILTINRESTFMEERDYLISVLLIELFNDFVQQTKAQSASDKIDYVKEWIRTHMSNDMNVASVAEAIGLNRDYLTRLFKKKTGMTVLQYVNKQRLAVATTLLLRTELTVKEIAYESYFTNPKMLMKRFKKETGLSPSEYRKRYQTVHKNTDLVDPIIPVPKRLSDSINRSATGKLGNTLD